MLVAPVLPAMFRAFVDRRRTSFADLVDEARVLVRAPKRVTLESSPSLDAIAHVVAVFVDECRPSDASPQATWLALIGTAIFFHLDDLPSDERASMTPAIVDVLGGHAPGSSEMSLFTGFRSILDRIAGGDEIAYSFIELLDGMLTEARMEREGLLSLENYDEVRANVVFVRQYQGIWKHGEGLRLPAEFEPHERRLGTLACQIISLVNDAASLSSEGTLSLNKIGLLMRSGRSIEEAWDLTKREHDGNASLLLQLAEELASSHRGERSVTRFIEQTLSTTRGNLRASQRLRGERYRFAAESLAQFAAHPLYRAGESAQR